MPGEARLQRPPLSAGDTRGARGLDAEIAGRGCRPTSKGVRTGQQFVTYAGQRIHIVTAIGSAALQQFAACIGWSQGYRPAVGLIRIQLRANNWLRSAEIKDANLALARYQQVAWFEVAVNDAALVRVLQSCAQLPDDLPCLKPLYRCRAHAFNQITEQFAIEEFHREKNDIPVAVEFEYVDDVPMRQQLAAMRFAPKVPDHLFREAAAGVRYLQSDILLGFRKRRAIPVERFEHNAFTAGSKSFLNDIPFP